jgi:hypothetical protein
MFRVPANPVSPTFDDATKVGFCRWLLSSKAERMEWMRRRNVAADNARINQNIRGSAKAWELLRNQAKNRLAREIAQGRRTQEEADAFLRQLDESGPPMSRSV